MVDHCCSVPDVFVAVGQKVLVLRGRDNGQTIQQYCFEVLWRSVPTSPLYPFPIRFSRTSRNHDDSRAKRCCHFPTTITNLSQFSFSWRKITQSRVINKLIKQVTPGWYLGGFQVQTKRIEIIHLNPINAAVLGIGCVKRTRYGFRILYYQHVAAINFQGGFYALNLMTSYYYLDNFRYWLLRRINSHYDAVVDGRWQWVIRDLRGGINYRTFVLCATKEERERESEREGRVRRLNLVEARL